MAGILIATRRRGTVSWRLGGSLLGVLLVVAGLGLTDTTPSGATTGPSSGDVRILGGVPASFDPAAQGDVVGAALSLQLFEGLTAFDASLSLRPALAGSWDVLDSGRRIVFHLRPGLTFSDGSALTGADVVRSWLRLLDPTAPSPMASLMSDVVGADDYRSGRSRDAGSIGVSASGGDVTVRLISPAGDFPAVVAAAPFVVVPPGVADGSALVPDRFVGSGGYVLAAATNTELTLHANARYWAGRPAVGTVHVVTDIGGRSIVTAFEDGDLDYAQIGSYDASWIRFDATLGPQLRSVPSLSVEYLGFDTSRVPFNDVRVRQAFAAAVDWRRVVGLASAGGETVATSMVPPGVPGRSATDFLPAYQPETARSLLAQAGFPAGRGFPTVTFVTGGTAYGAAIRVDLQATLGITIGYETMGGDEYATRLSADPPAIWSLGWVADYPGPNDFLGVLLRSDSTSNVGRWSSAEFDQAIADAGAASGPAQARAAFDRAQAIVRRDAPLIPLAYGDGWALSRKGLLGAGQNGLTIFRFAGLAWGGS